MKELITVLKATMHGEMSIFAFQKKNNKYMQNVRAKFLGIILFAIVLFTMGTYAYMLAEPLNKVNMTYIVITLFSLVSTVLVFVEGIYKSQGILFDAKDSDLLFSMPIKKSTILTARFIKFIYFEYIWNFIIMAPTFAVYAYFVKPIYTFYIAAIIVFIALPIIPTVVACIVGYIIQAFASKFKFKKVAQSIVTLAFSALIILYIFRVQEFVNNIAEKSKDIEDLILKLYYPIGVYVRYILNFKISDLAIIIIINLAILIVFIIVFSFGYSKLISKLSEKSSNSNYKIKKIKGNSQFKALIKKELKRYFTSPIYVMNTIIGPIMMIGAGIYVIISKESFLTMVATEFGGLNINYSIMFMLLAMFSISMTCVTASSISLEGKSFSLTKSLPVSEKKIFNAKMIVNLLVTLPFAMISLVLFAVAFNFKFIDIIYSIILVVLMSFLEAPLGLVINLAYPKLDAKSDTVIVKQSASSMFTTFASFGLTLIPLILFFALDVQNTNLFIGIGLACLTIFTILVYIDLYTRGVKKFRKLNN